MDISTQNHFKSPRDRSFSSQPANIGFFYVGSDTILLEYFNQQFEFGYVQTDLYEACKFLYKLYQHNNKLPDVLFIDLPFDENELKQFHARLKNNILIANLPIVYNEKQLTNNQITKLRHLNVIDDVIDIDSEKINYFNKVLFLKQSKMSNGLFHAMEYRTRKEKNYARIVSSSLKRTIDITIASMALLVLSPLILLIALVIKMESRGPVFYTSLRAGKGFKVFKFYKFRSMVVNADEQVETLSGLNQYNTSNNGPKFFKVNNDPRVTRLGRFLRNTSVDELPQLFNVLKGDMSVVGNRPLPLYEAVTLTTNEYVERFSAPAGITGLWQVNKRGKAEISTEERIGLDIAYSRYCNIFSDIKILAKTPIALFQKSDV